MGQSDKSPGPGRIVSLLERTSSLLGLTDRLVGIACAFDPSGRFFEDGTGDLEPLRVYEEGFMRRLVAGMPAPPLELQVTGELVDASKNMRVRWLSCSSPMSPLLPEEVKELHVQIIDAADGTAPRGVAIHFPATADQTYTLRRRLMAEPLLRRGIFSILVTPPFYGRRRPAAQALHYTRSLRDFCLMTHGMIVEGWALVAWARRQPEWSGAMVGLTGVSMGGSIAAIASAICPGPLAIAPCLATFSGAGVYTEGVLSTQVAWPTFIKEQRCTLAQAKEHVARMLNRNDIHHVIDQLKPVPNVGPRSLVMLNARDDKYVTAAEARHLFSALAPTCGPGDASIRFIPGGHATSIVAGAPAFVQTVVKSFDVLERRLDLQRAEREALMHISVGASLQAVPPGPSGAATGSLQADHPREQRQPQSEAGVSQPAEASSSGRTAHATTQRGGREGGGGGGHGGRGGAAEGDTSAALQIVATSDDGVDLQECYGARGEQHAREQEQLEREQRRERQGTAPAAAGAGGGPPPARPGGDSVGGGAGVSVCGGDVIVGAAALSVGAAVPPPLRWVVPSKL